MNIDNLSDEYIFYLILFISLIVLVFLLTTIYLKNQNNGIVVNNEIAIEPSVNKTVNEENIILEKNFENNLNDDEMYYCFKLDKNDNKIFESYLSNNYFYESYNFGIKDEKIFYKNRLYQTFNENNCDFIIENYDNIYNNFKLSFMNEYLNRYNCEKIDYNENIFFIDKLSLKICDVENLSMRIMENEN